MELLVESLEAFKGGLHSLSGAHKISDSEVILAILLAEA